MSNTTGNLRDSSSLSTGELVTGIRDDVRELVKAQVDLAKAELRADLEREKKMAIGVGAAALLALVAVSLLFVTAILALSTVMPGWAAGLCVSGVVLLSAVTIGALGWSKRVRRPFARTRRQLNKDARFTKERVA